MNPLIESDYHLPAHPQPIDLEALLDQADRLMIRLVRSENATALLQEAIEKRPDILTIELHLRSIIQTDVDSALAELVALKAQYLANCTQVVEHFATLEKLAQQYKKGTAK